MSLLYAKSEENLRLEGLLADERAILLAERAKNVVLQERVKTLEAQSGAAPATASNGPSDHAEERLRALEEALEAERPAVAAMRQSMAAVEAQRDSAMREKAAGEQQRDLFQERVTITEEQTKAGVALIKATFELRETALNRLKRMQDTVTAGAVTLPLILATLAEFSYILTTWNNTSHLTRWLLFLTVILVLTVGPTFYIPIVTSARKDNSVTKIIGTVQFFFSVFVTGANTSPPPIRASTRLSKPHCYDTSARPPACMGLAQLQDQDRLHPSKWPFMLVHMDDVPKSAAGRSLRIKLAMRLTLGQLSDEVRSLSIRPHTPTTSLLNLQLLQSEDDNAPIIPPRTTSLTQVACKCTSDPCRSCVLLECTSLGFLRKRDPPKAYINAIKARLHQVGTLAAVGMSYADPSNYSCRPSQEEDWE
ncbi:hypothetical protein DFH08DRAFT_979457 [Mycena albidolilacea]|uniref:1,3-beta-glucan synthase component FKS1-like domain-containing protein n=1 Tax=Mycena albidolilacea TaxID=1033008 RepID=A0AAD6YWY8_9AGAR|nr:hypothetical protein DFH08DRAFT_979457 [Mycena albidolilacea]